MTDIIERRWKCEWCGNVSPVLVPTGEFFGYETPKGWIEVSRGYGTDRLYGDCHFCCAMHETLWKQRRAESAETPEEAKV